MIKKSERILKDILEKYLNSNLKKKDKEFIKYYI